MKTKINLNSHFAQQVIAAALAGCDAVKPGEIREARQLCGLEFWDSLSKRQQPLAGQIISQAVDDRLLPLIKTDLTRSNHLRYQRV